MLGDIELIYLVSFLWFLIVCFTDFCYFVNLSVALQTAFFPDHLLWYKVSIKTNISRQCDLNLNNIFKANYMLAMGPLMTAIMVWKNSLVFHSLDKLTSMYSDADSYIFNVQKLIFDWSMWIFFGNLPPGFSMPSLLWRYISFVGVSSRTSTSGNIASLYLSKKEALEIWLIFLKAWGRPVGFGELRSSCWIVSGLAA